MTGQHHRFNRILDIPCRVCDDFSSGKHYNIFACDGCAGFFKRSIRSNRQYICRALSRNMCIIDKTRRNQCKACRLIRCLKVGMNRDAVQRERGSRTSKMSKKGFTSTPAPSTRNKSNNKNGLRHELGPINSDFISTPTEQRFCHHTLLFMRIEKEIDLCENAAQLLFMNIKWIKTIAAFTSLPFADQLVLVEQCWKELFILGATQFMSFKEISAWLQNCRALQLKECAILQEFYKIIRNIKCLHLDQHEITYLRSIALFNYISRSKPVNYSGIVFSDVVYIEFIQNYLKAKLYNYINLVKPNELLRFEKLLQVVFFLRYIPESIIEGLFFKKTIGAVPVTKIITDMYKTQVTL